jgi:hypothetical protein
MPGMLIDNNQSSGTMFGLSSQLVLCARDMGSRRVIIPYGLVHFKLQGAHVNIVVDTQSHTSVQYQEYTIDTDLGRLVGNVTMINRLYKIYLHALSGYCLPDPLTGRTGTEEALHELRSAGCLSFQKLGADETDILCQINSLTPRRTFYPIHLEVMQTVEWSDLAPTAQHHDFYVMTNSIMEYAKSLQVFHAEQSELEVHSNPLAHLLKRAAHRNVLFYPEEFAGPMPSSQDDAIHDSRDISVYQAASDECAVVTVSAMVHDWPSGLNTCSGLFGTLKVWDCLKGPSQDISLSYSRDWLKPDLATTWISLYNLCRQSSNEPNRFRMVFSLSALAYGSPPNRDLIPTILAFATVPEFRNLHPPSWLSYNLSRGFHPDTEILLDIVHRSVLSFEDSPESKLPCYYGENEVALQKRRFTSYKVRRDAQATEVITRLINQWPCEKPDSPSCPADRSVALIF